MEEPPEPFLSGYLLDGGGSCRVLGPAEIEAWKPGDGTLWVHLDRSSPESVEWLEQHASMPALAREALLREDVRARTLVLPSGVLAVLRGINTNPADEPEDMVALRLWIEEERVIDLRHRKLRAVSDVREKLAGGLGPTCVGDLFLELADTMINLIEPVIDRLEEEVEELETGMEEGSAGVECRKKLASIRRRTIRLRRYLAPQREALNRLRVEPVSWLNDHRRARLLETVERITHILEDLDCVREHAAVAQDELVGIHSEASNVTMLRLSVIAAVLLPPSLIAGLLGANVAGIPWRDRPDAFAIVCVLVCALALFEVWLMRRWKWM